MSDAIPIDIVSDVACPWCFIGKRHLEAALAQCDLPVSIRWLPYFLNPDTPPEGEAYRPFLERKFGGAAALEGIWARVRDAGVKTGIDFAFEKIELRANTLHAHRLIYHAQTVMSAARPETVSLADGAGGTAIGDLVEALFAAQFLAGRHVGDRAVLADVAASCGMEREAVLRYLESAADAEAVRGGADEARRKGINGVPFFIFNNRLAASGAQPPQALLQVMRQAAQEDAAAA